MRISDWSSDVCSSDLTIAGVVTRNVNSLEDCEEINRIYVRCGMVPAPVDVLWENQQKARVVTVLVAESVETGQIVGTVPGVDHERLFADPEGGPRLRCLAADHASHLHHLAEALARPLIARFPTP